MPGSGSPSPAFDRVAGQYDATRGGDERGRLVAATLLPLLPATGPVLEVGIGTGLVAAALRDAGRPVVGVDLSAAMLRTAVERVPGRVAVADARHLPVAGGAVAAAYLIHVLHLVGDVDRVLAEVVRVVAPGGQVFTSVTRPWTPDVPDDVYQVISDLEREVGAADRTRPDDEADVLARAARHGLVHRATSGYRTPYNSLTPAQVADRVARRSWSWMWPCADAVWDGAARRAVERLRALPDQDVPRSRPDVYPLLVFART